MSRVIAFVPPPNVAAARAFMSRQTARWIGITMLFVYALTGSGHIAGSDERAMLDLSRAMLRGHIDLPDTAMSALRGPDGRLYSKNTAGQAVLALPLVAVAEVATARLPMTAPRRLLAMRFVVSFFNAVVAALLLALFYRAARSLGTGVQAALDATLMLALTTPLWPYAKTFTAEPLQMLGLLMVLDGSARAAQGEARAAWAAGWGLLVATTVKLSMLPLALVCLLPLTRARWTAWLPPALMLIAALALNAAYNHARFGTFLESGYGAQATWASHTTPLPTGLYGLLVSSGKGVMWFAPALWLAIPGWIAMRRGGPIHARVVAAVAAAWAIALVLYGTFEHWAGDGSFGPRYLMPLVPLAFLPVAWFMDQGGWWRRSLAVLLATAGLAVQIGGVGIYFGVQMREAGDYPYTRALNDPQFMHESHFVPGHSPILGHWRMLIRNTGEHLQRKLPKLAGGEDVDPRLGIGPKDQEAMLHALDFWWLYAAYAGVAPLPIVGAMLVLLGIIGWAALRMLMVADEEAQAA